MAVPTIEGGADEWMRVARFVQHRRLELGLTQAQAIARSGGRISLAVWSLVENGHPQNGRLAIRSAQGVCAALGWDPSSIEDVLAGGSPIVAGESLETGLTVEDRLDRLEEQMDEVLSRLPELDNERGAH